MHVVKCFQSIVRKPSIVAGFAFVALMLMFSFNAVAQGGGAIEGTVTDSTGAVVANANITIVNTATQVTTIRHATEAGFFSIPALTVGDYTATVSAAGFETLKQEHLLVDNDHVTGYNPKLKVGVQTETITVTDEPPELETANANLGGTVRNAVYTELPIMLLASGASNSSRDITTFSDLLPGAQVAPGGRISQFNGLPQRMAELYFDGIPVTELAMQGDNRPVYNVVPVEMIDQIQVQSSGFSAESHGAGFEGFSSKSGGSQYHGTAYEIIRNTMFDGWSFANKCGVRGQIVGPDATGVVQQPGYVGCGNTVPDVVNGVPVVTPTGAVVKLSGPKQGDHEDEYGFAGGGPVKFPGHSKSVDKLFFFGGLTRFHSLLGANPSATTIPTERMTGLFGGGGGGSSQPGDFRELLPASAVTGGVGNIPNINYPIYDPTTEAACTANNSTMVGTPAAPVSCRYQYGYGPGAGKGALGNPVLVNAGKANVIPAGEISPQMVYLQKFLPQPALTPDGNISNNYLGAFAAGFNNWLWAVRVDYDISDKNRVFGMYSRGDRHSIPYNGNSVLPLPYLTTFNADVAGHFAEIQDAYTITPNISNQLRYGYLYFGGPPQPNVTQGNPAWNMVAAGVTNLPAGQASTDFPYTTFSGSNAPSSWGSSSGQAGIAGGTHSYILNDNILWVKGRNAFNFGAEYAWLENNAGPFAGPSGFVNLGMSLNETAQPIQTGANSYVTNSGYSYASFLIGAMDNPSVTQQPFAVYGVRERPLAPYFQDDFKLNPKLTLNLGMRWDYMPVLQEVLDRYSFLNPTVTNPNTGNPGALQFAGTWGGAGTINCNCHSPMNNWHKNFAPRLGFAYAANDKTVIRGSYSIMFTHGGGTGGSNGNDITGENGFTIGTSFNPSTAGASFYLNTNPAFPTTGGGNVAGPNSNFGGASYTFPVVNSINITPALAGYLTGNYVTGTPSTFVAAQAQNYADPYVGGRAPEMVFFNLGVQRELTKTATVSVNYVGTQGHFLPGPTHIRGQYADDINPSYLASIGMSNAVNLSSAATAANVATVQTACGNCIPTTSIYPWYEAAAAVSSTATIGHMLTWMPQYSSVSDTYGVDVANSMYNALQLRLDQRVSHGLTMTLTYTFSKTMDDVGSSRSGFAIPTSVIATGRAWKQNLIDRTESASNTPQLLNIFGVYKLPFGKGGYGASHFFVRAVAGNWELSGISQYSSGLPLVITSSAAGTSQSYGQGTFQPDINPNFHGSPRINGKWGSQSTAVNLASLPYITGYLNTTVAGQGANAVAGATNSGGNTTCANSVGPFCNPQNNTIGDNSRVGSFNLRGPSTFRLTASINRTFDLSNRFKFVFRVDCMNVTNHVTFGNNASNNSIGVNPTSATFGQVSIASGDARSFQFQGRLKF